MKSQSEPLARKYVPSVFVNPALSHLPLPALTLNPNTSNSVIMAPNLPPGARKANGMEVNISGFYGIHPIETGVAYWYRGHYIYSTAGIPVEPVPFATKKGVHIVGTTIETAPPFRLGGVPGDRYEIEVAALHSSMVHAWKEQEKEKETGEAVASGDQTDEIQGLKPADQEMNPAQNRFRLEVTKNEAGGYYNDRAMFLAQSAPGSQHGTPTPSRSNTPMQHGTRSASMAPFRAVASTSRMQTLLEQAPVIEGLLALQEKHPGVSSRNTSIHKDIPGPSMFDLVKAREQTASRAGRTRSDSMKAASLALNVAFNDSNRDVSGKVNKKNEDSVLKCCIHGGDCDGVTVTTEHLTLKNLKIRGFKEAYPVVINQGRTMIDWYTLMKEESHNGK
ncbi:uncharacterized protein N0V89_009147 [Didymosphaeria variabile]|uniref:Uncharacterized protein n=1 Tax=Didymosphaeria variabile TaxID=1932322 RepID=A0A9W9C984_9PLEO|nr:uncharacterized protein N0V89_009147 [Didymosphaeria variabile]KAJ4350526.1 hypothetical protein N0V89_009147 [Didymosphaeria variabile]